MNKTTQDLAWACLPKEVREEIRKRYKGWIESLSFGTEIILYNDLFGEHNLTSDTEPEEMLMVEKKRAIDLYSDALYSSNYSNDQRCKDIADGKIEMLQMLFGNKCLPDNENLSETKDNMEEKDFGKEDNFPTKELEHGLEQTRLSRIEMSKLNGIIIDGIAYEAVRRGSYHCSDCDLRKQCEAHPILFNSLCLCDFWGERIIFKTYRH